MVMKVPRKVVPEVQTQALPGVTQRIDTPEGMFGDGGRGLAKAADALDKLGASFDKRATDMQDEQNASRALELETMARREAMEVLYHPENGLLTKKGGNALGVEAEMAKRMEGIRAKYGNIQGDSQAVRDLVGTKLKALEETTLDTARRHQFGEFQSYKSEQLAARQTANTEDVALNFNDEKNFTAKWEDNLKALTAQSTQEGWSVEQYRVKRTQLYSTMRAAQIVSMVGQDTPDAILKAKEVYDEAQGRGMMTFEDATKLDKLFDVAVPKAAAQKAYMGLGAKAALTDKDAIINYVIDNFEGGDKVANEPKGGIAKFGINSIANPDVDVKNLTREGAVKLKTERYWNAIKADELPESIRFIAYDTAVNHGVEKAKELIEKANGNPKVLIELRYKEYLRLAKSDPKEYGQYLPGWKDRLANLSGQLTTNVDQATVEASAAQLDLEYPGAGEELLALHKSSVERTEQAQKIAKKEFLDTVMPKLYASNGDWSQLTAQEKNKAIELGVWDDVSRFNGVTNPAVGTLVAQMSPEDILATDFTEAKWRGNMSQSDYESVLKKQTDLREKPSARGEFRTTAGIVSEAWKSIGKKTSDIEYYTFQSAVEDAFSAEIEARGGKPLTSDDKRAIVSKLVMNTSVGSGWWFDGAQKRVYQLDPEEAYQISGQSPEVVDAALKALVSSNQEPNQKNVARFIENPSDFIRLPGYNDTDIAGAVRSLMKAGATVNPSSVKTYLERKNRQAAR